MGKESPKTYTRNYELAMALEKQPAWLSRWKREPGWPVRVTGPWTDDDVQKIRDFVESKNKVRFGGGDKSADDGLSISDRLKVAQTELTQLKRDLLDGKYIEVDIHNRAVVAVGMLFVRELDALVSRLPPKMITAAEHGPGEVERVVRDEFDSARRRLSEAPKIELGRAEMASRKKTKAGPGRKKGGRKK
jgi:hypothetical protein